MIREKEIQECIDVVNRIETLVRSIEGKLGDIAEDLKSDLGAMRERDFWEDYQHYMHGKNV